MCDKWSNRSSAGKEIPYQGSRESLTCSERKASQPSTETCLHATHLVALGFELSITLLFSRKYCE